MTPIKYDSYKCVVAKALQSHNMGLKKTAFRRKNLKVITDHVEAVKLMWTWFTAELLTPILCTNLVRFKCKPA